MTLEVLWILAFILVFFYLKLTELVGTSTCMFTFATCCLSGAVFYLIQLPETKGKTYEEIMQILAKWMNVRRSTKSDILNQFSTLETRKYCQNFN